MKTTQNGLMQIMKKALIAITLIVMFMYSLERFEKLQVLRDKACYLFVVWVAMMWAIFAQIMTIMMDGMTKAIVTWDQTQEGCKNRRQCQIYK